MKNSFFYIIFFLSLSGVFHPAWAQPVNNTKLLDSIVAIVNDNIILSSELEERTVEAVKDLAIRNIAIDDPSQLKIKVLDAMILERLQQERIKQLGLDVSDEEVFAQLQKIAEQNNLSIAQLRENLNSQQINGFQKTRNKIREQMLIQKLRDVDILARTQVTEGEIDNFLQRTRLQNQNIEYHLQHIMLALPENSTPQEKQQIQRTAQNILDKIAQGQDFSELAVKYSTGNKALKGGNLGWLGMDKIPTFFLDAVVNLDTEEVSYLITSPIGFHIVKLLGKRDKDILMTNQYKLYQLTISSKHAINPSIPPAPLLHLSRKTRSLEDFNTLIKQLYGTPYSVNKTRYLGWKTIKQLPLNYAEALKTIHRPGQATAPFATEQGWVILYLDNIRQTDLNQTNKRLQAMQTIRIQKANETFEIWLRRLKEDASIDNRLINPINANSIL